METHSSILAWRIPLTEKPGRLQSIGLHRVRHHWSNLAPHSNLELLHASLCLSQLLWLIQTLVLNYFVLIPTNNRWWEYLRHTAAATAKSLQSCPTLCDPIDGSLPGSPVPGILQARTLEWVAISFSNVWKWKVKVKSLSRVRTSATPWTAAFQAPPSMGFSRQEYWSGVPLPSLIYAMGIGKCYKPSFSLKISC